MACAPAQVQAEPEPLPTNVILSEVVHGTLEYVELYNPTNVAKNVANLVLRTSQGVFSLQDVTTPLGAHQRLLLLRGRPEEVGTSNDATIPIKIVSAPILGALVDTVLLETRTGVVLDAMSYGVTQDTSPLYTRATGAGQFAPGQFVAIGQVFSELALGRRANSADTNDLAADWSLHGGADSYVPTPLEANADVVGGSVYSIKSVQARVNELFNNVYFTDVTTAGYTAFSGTPSNNTAVHSFTVASFELGAMTFTGTVDYQFQGGAGGDYTIQWQGLLNASTGTHGFSVSVDEARSGNTTTITVAADLFDVGLGGMHRPYTETCSMAASGTRGNYTIVQARSLTDWFGIQRDTNVRQGVAWTVNGGRLVSSACNVSIVRDYPTTPAVPWSGPNPVFTTETLTYTSLAQATPGGAEIVFPTFRSDFGSYGVADHTNARIDYVADTTANRVSVSHSADITFPDPNGWLTQMEIVANATLDPATGNIAIDGHLLESGTEHWQFQGFIDPPAGARVFWPTWGEIWEGTKTTAKYVGHAAATVVTGGVCALATTAVAGTAGITSVASLGTATPLGIGATAVTGGACVYVSNVVYEVTHP